jgi:hypothetical protein
MKRCISNERGQATVEFALILPVLLLIVLGIIEFGRAWNIQQVVTDAAREGARRAVIFDPTITQAMVEQEVEDRLYAARIDTTKTDIQWVGTWHDSGDPMQLTISFPYTWMFFNAVFSPITIVSSFTMRNE